MNLRKLSPIVFLLVSSLGFSLSPKEEAIQKLTGYQELLKQSEQQMTNLQSEILTLSLQIEALQKELEASKNKSQQIIDGIKSDLEKSKADLLASQTALQTLKTSYEQLSKDLKALKFLLKVYEIGGIILAILAVIETSYIIIDGVFVGR